MARTPDMAREALPETEEQPREHRDSLDVPTPKGATQPAEATRVEPAPRVVEPVTDQLVARAAKWLARELGSAAARNPRTEAVCELAQACRTAENLAAILGLRGGLEPLSPMPIDIGDLVMTVLPAWKPRAPRHTFELALLGDAPPIVADAERVAQAMDRLLAAVIRVTPEGVTVRVSVRPGPAGSDEVVLSVRHSGVALASALSEGDPFEIPAMDAANSQTSPNAALDLTLAREIVAAHGGRVEIERDPGAPRRGLAIVCAWPLVPRVAPRAAPLADAAVRESLAGAAFAPASSIIERDRPMILVVEGEPRMARFLKANLGANGYGASVAQDVAAARRIADLEVPDLVLLDGGLAGDERLEPLRRLIADSGCPVMILARRSDPLACARVLDVGGTDWLARPFTTEELLARIRAALRRNQSRTALGREAPVVVGELRVDLAQRLASVEGRPVALSKTEFKLLAVLARSQGAVIAHDVLLERVWGPGYGDAVEFVWVYIRRLRRKLEPDPAHPRFILTAPGVGYRLAQPI
ncbi:MAG TPA: winged helix-turn-helix domain-containing protein [Ktedonobacterales bacterium]